MEHQERIWFVDPARMRDVVVDREALEARLDGCTDLERVWVLSYAYQRLYRWRDAAQVQERALRVARTTFREAQVRHQIGRRLFDAGLFLAAAAEFDWAADLFKAAGRPRAAGSSYAARDRALKVHRQSRFSE